MSLSVKAAGAAVAAAVFLAGAAHGATNLVNNGSFEKPPLDFAWTYSGTGYGGADVNVNPTTIIDYNSATPYPTGAFGEAVTPDNSLSDSPDAVGGHAAYFVADNSVETLTQKVFFNAGRYMVGFSVYLPQNGVNNPVDAKFTGSIAGLSLADFSAKAGDLPAKTWRSYSGVTTITTAGLYDVAFSYDTRLPDGYTGSSYGADVVVDRVFAIAVPEPATWALMIVGFGSAGAMLRRRRAALALS